MDETKGTAQDTSPDNTGQSPSSKSGTPKDKGKLYSDAEIAKIKSDAAAMGQGRERKAAEQEKETLKQDLQSATSRLDALERERNESRLAEARGDPDQLRNYQREQELKKLEREVTELQRDLTRREAQVKADREAVEKDRSVVSLAYIAAKHGLETEELESLGISDPEALERVAEKLAAGKPKEPTGGKEEEGEETEEYRPDSGETTGGAGSLDALEKANDDFAQGRINEKQLREVRDKVK